MLVPIVGQTQTDLKEAKASRPQHVPMPCHGRSRERHPLEGQVGLGAKSSHRSACVVSVGYLPRRRLSCVCAHPLQNLRYRYSGEAT